MSCCNSCYTLCSPIPDCLITLDLVNSNLTISQQVTVKIKDKFGKIWKQDIIVSPDKSVTLDLMISTWREQLLNQYAGEFDISIEKDGVIIPFTKSGVDYDCIRTSVESITPKLSSYKIDI
jgi:hypothetical protein